MKHTATPALRLIPESIRRSFQISDKKHLFLTGGRGAGKSTLIRELAQILAKKSPALLPGITTIAVPQKYVLLYENIPACAETVSKRSFPADDVSISQPPGHSCAAVIGRFSEKGFAGNKMVPVTDGFFSLGIPALRRAAVSESGWALIDEVGYLESACPEFQNAVRSLLEQKRVLAVIRKQNLPFLTELCSREDAFVLDLDAPVFPVGCVIMASGLSRRFGSNKLLAPFDGQPLISRILETTGNNRGNLFARRVAITRTPEAAEICKTANVPVLLHNLPLRSDTVRLGLEFLLNQKQMPAAYGTDSFDTGSPDTLFQKPENPLRGCMFCSCDQPLLRRESLEALCLTFSRNPDRICRLGTKENPGSPILFPAWLFPELLALPEGCGGSFLAKKYPEQVVYVPARDDYELIDADTPETLATLSQVFQTANPNTIPTIAENTIK